MKHLPQLPLGWRLTEELLFEIVVNMKANPLLWLVIVGAIIWTIGDVIMQRWLDSQNNLYKVLGILIWGVGLFFLAETFKYKQMAVASTMMVALNSVLLVLVTWLFFKQQLTLTQIVGILFGLVGLFLLETS